MSLNESEKHRLLTELEQFHDELIRYKELVLAEKDGKLINKQKRAFQTLSLGLQRKYGSLKEVIEKYGGPAVLLLQGGNYECEAFSSAFNYTLFSQGALTAVMDTAITTVNIAIGNLRSLTPPETGQIQAPGDSGQMAKFLFDKMQFHPKIIEACESLFKSQHYAQAILEAFKAVNNFVKQKSGLSFLDGKDLMAQALREENPAIRLNEGRTRSDKDEQEGFKFLFMGAMVGIRNPKAHDNIVQTDPYRTLEYLGFASLLMRRIEEGEITRPQEE